MYVMSVQMTDKHKTLDCSYEQSLSSTAALRGVAERFNILIQEHQLAFPDAVDALADLGFTLADFASVETLQLKLSLPVLLSLLDRLYFEHDWLARKRDQVFLAAPHSRYKAMDVAADKLADAKRSCAATELTLYVKNATKLDMIDDEQDLNCPPHFLPVLTRANVLAASEALGTYEVWDEGRWPALPRTPQAGGLLCLSPWHPAHGQATRNDRLRSAHQRQRSSRNHSARQSRRGCVVFRRLRSSWVCRRKSAGKMEGDRCQAGVRRHPGVLREGMEARTGIAMKVFLEANFTKGSGALRLEGVMSRRLGRI